MRDRRRDDSDDAARDRNARDQAAYLGGLAWLGVLIASLSLAGGMIYTVYRAFAGFFTQYGAPAGEP